MSNRIRIAICGYGNLGRGIEGEISKNSDMELTAVFTRRTSLQVKSDVPVVHIDLAAEWKDKVDVMILCGGSATDLPIQGPEFAKLFNTVDSFDTHAKILEYLETMDKAAKSGGNVSLISTGWDPGLFSLMRLYAGSIIPQGETHTFWGKGVSQGHSGAIRGIEGVENAVQYSIPIESAMEKARKGEGAGLTTRDKHTRLCYVVAAEGADKALIEKEIKEMPYYFSDYDTTVNFISAEELKANHSALPHGGNMIHVGKTGEGNSQAIELSLKLDSNPEFTSSMILACARAVHRLSVRGEVGAKTIFDIPPILLAERDRNDMIKESL